MSPVEFKIRIQRTSACNRRLPAIEAREPTVSFRRLPNTINVFRAREITDGPILALCIAGLLQGVL